MKIAIIVPMEEEAEYYRSHFKFVKKEMFGPTTVEHFSHKGNDAYLVLSGIGKVNAAMNLTALLLSKQISLVFMTGSAGSLQSDVKKKDLILPNVFAYHDAHNTASGDYVEGQIPEEPALFKLDSPERASFLAYLREKHHPFKEGMIVTGDSFICGTDQKQAILKNFPQALGVEMEGAAFAQVAAKFGVPLIALRSISDSGDENAGDDFATFVREAGKTAATIISSYLEEKVLF